MRGIRRFCALAAVSVAALYCVAAAASAPTDTTYSATQTVAVPPASSFAGSGGGDGWALALSNDKVFQVFHHTYLTIACHLQSNAQPCWSPVNFGGSTYITSYKPGMYLNQTSGKLYVYVDRTTDNSAGVACIDTTGPSFCGYTQLTPANTVQSYLYISSPVISGTKFYAFNYSSGSTASGGRNQLMCFDTATGAACAGQPFDAGFPSGSFSVGSEYTVASAGGRFFIPGNVNGPKVACFDPSTESSCGGSWPVSVPSDANIIFPRLDTNGTATGICMQGTSTCWGLDGTAAAAPANLTSVIPYEGYNFLSGPAVTIGSRVYLPQTSANRIACYDYSTSAACPNFPHSLPNLSLAYTINADPQRPTCLWANADNGGSQIQNFDAYTGGACGSGVTRVLTSQFVVPQQECYPSTYQSLQVVSPAPGTYTSGTVQFADGGGNPISGISAVTLDSNGVADLSGLDLTTANGLPQYLISLTGASTQQITVKLTWGAAYDPACVGSGTDVAPKPTTLTASLSGGGDSAPSLRVDPGTDVTASSTLSGDNAASAGGTTTYTWYSDAACTTVAATGADVNLPVGVYDLVASYSGDPGNDPSSTNCGDNVLTVRNPDTTPPVTTSDAPSGWQNHDVTVTLSATDDLSGVASTYYTVDGGATQSGTSFTLGEGVHAITFWSLDNAGNVETANTATVRIDETNPTLSASVSPNPVAVGASATADPGASDGGSGIASAGCDAPSTSTAGVFSVNCTATDNAGNTASQTVQYTVYTPLGSGTNTCTGIVGGSGGALDVPAGANCTVLPGTQLSGDVTVSKGASLTCNGATFGHDLHVDQAASVSLSFCTVVHDLQIVGVSGSVSVTDSSVGHDMHVVNNDGPIQIAADSVGHDLHVENNTGGGAVGGNTIGHDLSIKNNSGGLSIGSNAAGHSSAVKHNS